MVYRVVFAPEAQEQLAELYRYIYRASSDTLYRFELYGKRHRLL